jgi:hypothetical protein
VVFGNGIREWFWGATSYRETEALQPPAPDEQEADPLQIEKMMEIIATFGFREA